MFKRLSVPGALAIRWMSPVTLLILILVGCAAPSSQSQSPTQPEAPRIQRTLVLGTGRLLTQLGNWGVQDDEARDVVHAGLIQRNLTNFQWYGWMAEDLPSLDRGTLRIDPGGTMVATWKLRPNIKWHDGTAFTSKDLAFSLELAKDPNLPNPNKTFANVVERAETPDDLTWVVYLRAVSVEGIITSQNRFHIAPRHLLEPIYRTGDDKALENQPYWTGEFIGAGPYRVLDFKPAEILEVEAFNDYFFGRPKIDRITWRLIGDRQVMLANIISNAVDVTLRDALTWDGGLVAKERWEAEGQGTVLLSPTNSQGVGPGLSPWFEDLRVRHALLHAIDREEIKQTLSQGLVDVAHIPMVPGDPAFPKVLAAATKYDYNPQRALSILQDAGWSRGADAILVNQRGERFSLDFQAATGTDNDQVQAPIVEHWRAIGVESRINNMSQRTMDSEEFRNRWPGMRVVTIFSDPDNWNDRYGSGAIPTEATRWVGLNTGRWANPEADRTLAELANAKILEPRRVPDLYVRFGQLYSRDLPQLPIRYTVSSTTYRTGLINILPRYGGAGHTRTWNVHLWEWTQ